MSISGINGSSTQWQWQSRASQAGSGTAGSGGAANSGGISNSGTTAATGSLAAFMQAFSTDLQSMLAQSGGNTTSTAPTNAGSTLPSDGTSGSTDASQITGGTHHHRHHHHASGAGGGAQGAANQLVGAAASSLRNGGQGTDQIGQSASVLATDVMQALQAYGSRPATSSGTAIVA